MTTPSVRILSYKYYVVSGVGVAAVKSLTEENQVVFDKIQLTHFNSYIIKILQLYPKLLRGKDTQTDKQARGHSL